MCPEPIAQPAAETVGLDAVPVQRPTLAQVRVDDEAVVFAPETGRTHHLNAATTAVWTCLDAVTPLRELAQDIAAVSGWQLEQVEADVVELVRGFGARGLLAGVAPAQGWRPVTARGSADPGRLRLIPVSQAECAQRTLLEWAATRTVRVGEYLVGVRSATPELDGLVVDLLRTRLVEDVQAPPNYSLRLGSDDGPAYHRLLQACDTPVRTRSLGRLLRALVGFLDAHAAEDDASAVHVDAFVLARDGAVVLLPPQLRQVLTDEDELRSHGFAILDAQTAALDPATGELVVAPTTTVDEPTLRDAAALAPEPTEPPPTLAPGRYPVRCWADVRTGPSRSATRAGLVEQANRRVRNRAAVGASTALHTLARAASGARPVVLEPSEDGGTRLRRLGAALDAMSAQGRQM